LARPGCRRQAGLLGRAIALSLGVGFMIRQAEADCALAVA
jgi:hypothetical protein